MTRPETSETLITKQIKSAAPGGFVSRVGLLLAAAALLALAVPTGLIALVEGLGLMPLPYNLYVVDLALPGIFKVHMLASGAALVLMPLVFAARKHAAWHRPLGRITAAFVVAGALTSFPVAYESTSVLPARAGFVAQGLVWLALIVEGVRAIRGKERARHATLMAAMAAVASGAIWVRLTTAVATSWDWPFDSVYACATWLGWLVPLALVLSFAPVSILPRRRAARSALAT
jgi:uncharacterized membrane protein